MMDYEIDGEESPTCIGSNADRCWGENTEQWYETDDNTVVAINMAGDCYAEGWEGGDLWDLLGDLTDLELALLLGQDNPVDEGIDWLSDIPSAVDDWLSDVQVSQQACAVIYCWTQTTDGSFHGRWSFALGYSANFAPPDNDDEGTVTWVCCTIR